MKSDFVFISLDAGCPPRGKDLSLVRSHAMRGVNSREDSRRSRQARRRKQREIKKAGIDGSATADALIDSPTSAVVLAAVNRCVRVLFTCLPFQDVDCIRLPEYDGRRSESRELLQKYGIIKTLMYPIDNCVDFKLLDECIDDFSTDLAFYHSLLFYSSAIQDFTLQRPLGPLSYHHLRQTLHHLKATIAQHPQDKIDRTFFVVLSLCIVASVWCDDDALRVHSAGLKQLLEMRGGRSGQVINPKICFKLAHLDLSAYMSTGRRPCLLNGSVTWDSVFGEASMFHQHNPPSFVQLITDDRLLLVFLDCRYLVTKINNQVAERRRMLPGAVMEIFKSIQLRLLHLDGQLPNPLEECLRLAMVAFWSSAMRVPGRSIRYDYLSQRLRESCRVLHLVGSEFSDMAVWVLMMGAVSVFHPAEGWMYEYWLRCVPVGGLGSLSRNYCTMSCGLMFFMMNLA
ncbi:hypothetical protein B0I35DRAFT_64324 [Stachybotrys elegans]|uniref:Transcription factor domain-containing protein n=1 Tax=Stachybotrys elegans TaxID=80388 RepID=A0A8K0WNI7_9HYPO|nr:hypothetical protein B0I35DRAFT_64324 [Stachybotrys elegans]